MKNDKLRILDMPPPLGELNGSPDETSDDFAPPPPMSAHEPPTNVVLTPLLARSASTPMSLIDVTYDPPSGVIVERFTIQWSLSNSFPTGSTASANTPYEFYRIDGLKPGTLYYVRVQAWEHGIAGQWSNAVSTTTLNDTVAPAVPTGASGTFINSGDLKVTWTPPTLATSPNYRDTEITIWNSAAKTVQLYRDYKVQGEYIFPATLNYQVTSGSPDPSVYVELRTRNWYEQYSAIVAVGTVTKAVPLNPVLSAVWDGAVGSLVFDWSDIADAIRYDLVLDGKTYPVTSSKFVYDLARNKNDHSGTADPAITYNLKAVDGLLQSSTGVSSTITLAPPATPTGLTTSWAGDTGNAGPDCTLDWSAQTGIAFYRHQIDTKQREQTARRFAYNFDTNRADHAGTPDQMLSISLWAVDALGQASTTPATATATNAAPPTTAVVITAGFSAIAVQITASAAADFDYYLVRVIKDGGTLATYKSTSPDPIYKATANGSYQVGVKVVDKFGQQSTETVSAAVAIDAITIEDLRDDAKYTDSPGTDFTADPNKTVLRNDATGAGITYAASASAYRWTQLERVLTERIRRISVKLGSGSANFYIATSADATTWRWFAGVGGDGYTLTERIDEATAAANASLFSAATQGWVELPQTVECRYIRLYHRNTTTTYRLDEFYGYTIVIADMIRAGDIKALHIAAATITADKLNVLQLSAITADMGSLTAGTITGATIRTAASGARVELSAAANGGWVGYSSTDTYNMSTGAGTYQTRWSKLDGRFYAASGKVIIYDEGIYLVSSATAATFLIFGTAPGGSYGSIGYQAQLGFGMSLSSGHGIQLQTYGDPAAHIKMDTEGGDVIIGTNVRAGNVLTGGYVQSNLSSATSNGGAVLQGILDTDTSSARAWWGHNAWFDPAGSGLWQIDAIGANDATGILIPNGGGFYFIQHNSTGNTARTMSHATFSATTARLATLNVSAWQSIGRHYPGDGAADQTSNYWGYDATMHGLAYAGLISNGSVGFTTNLVGSSGSVIRLAGNGIYYFETHGGGWQMIDTTYIRAYNNKSIYTGGVIRGDAGFQAPGNNGANADYAIDGSVLPQEFAIANNGTATPFSNANVFGGMFIVTNMTNGSQALFITGGASIALVRESAANTYTVTSGTASRTNVYLVSSVVTIENKTGASVNYRVHAFRTRNAN